MSLRLKNICDTLLPWSKSWWLIPVSWYPNPAQWSPFGKYWELAIGCDENCDETTESSGSGRLPVPFLGVEMILVHGFAREGFGRLHWFMF